MAVVGVGWKCEEHRHTMMKALLAANAANEANVWTSKGWPSIR